MIKLSLMIRVMIRCYGWEQVVMLISISVRKRARRGGRKEERRREAELTFPNAVLILHQAEPNFADANFGEV